ncbi:MAG: VOC family protein, partial [Actinomycetota bacterium]|nr:VOC family protein [Actinomycetota bacterium]
MGVRKESWPAGTPAWVDISVTDPEASRTFYSSVLGWEFTDPDAEQFGGYFQAVVQGEAVAGMAPPMEGMDEPPHAWVTYLAVDDLETDARRIGEAGAQVIFPPMELESLGSMAMFVDPTGAMFGVWQSGEHTGFNLFDVPGAVAWNEAMVGDFEAGKEFYASVFGYRYADISSPDMQYVLASLTEGGDPVLGLGRADAGQPPYWSTNFAVEDADATVERVRAAGGGVLTEPFDFEYGRMAVVSGPDGE